MAQHDYTSQFNNVQANAKLVIHGHDGTEYEYLPFGTDVEVPADSYVIDTTITFAEFRDNVQPLGIPVVLLLNTAQGRRAYVFCGSDATYFHFVCIQGESLYWQKLSSNGWTNGSYSLDLIESANAPITIVGKSITNNGNLLTVTGNNAWAEGERTEATAGRAHAEGYMTKASAADAHAEGSNTRASGEASHAEGAGCTASGKASHVGGRGTRMSADGGTAIGNFNSDDTALFVVGNGTNTNNRSDALKVDANGDTWIMINGVLTNISSLLA